MDSPKSIWQWILTVGLSGAVVYLITFVTGLVRFPTKMDGLSSQVTKLDTDLGQVRDKVFELAEAKGAMEQAVKTGQQHLKELKEGAASFRDQVSTEVAALKKANEDLGETIEEIKKLQPEFTKLRTSIDELRGSVNGLDNRVGKLESTIADIGNPGEASERTFVVTLPDAGEVSKEDDRWRFVIKVPLEVASAQRVVSIDSPSWPPEWNAVLLEGKWIDNQVHILIYGDTRRFDSFFTFNKEKLVVRIVLRDETKTEKK